MPRIARCGLPLIQFLALAQSVPSVECQGDVSGIQQEIVARAERCITQHVRSDNSRSMPPKPLIVSSDLSDPEIGVVVANSWLPFDHDGVIWSVRSTLTFISGYGQFRITHTGLLVLNVDSDDAIDPEGTVLSADELTTETAEKKLQELSAKIARCMQDQNGQ